MTARSCQTEVNFDIARGCTGSPLSRQLWMPIFLVLAAQCCLSLVSLLVLHQIRSFGFDGIQMELELLKGLIP